MEVKSLTGEYKHTLDSKGRLFIPAKLREELGDVFYITLSMDKCISAYSAESWRAFSAYVQRATFRSVAWQHWESHCAVCTLSCVVRGILLRERELCVSDAVAFLCPCSPVGSAICWLLYAQFYVYKILCAVVHCCIYWQGYSC